MSWVAPDFSAVAAGQRMGEGTAKPASSLMRLEGYGLLDFVIQLSFPSNFLIR
jgi:hypothetical protein